MELQRNTANAFINYLIKHGYPKESIVTEWGYENHRIDIAILDQRLETPVAIYEIKGNKNSNSFRQGLNQLNRFMKFLKYPVEVGLVFPKPTSPYFEFVNLSGKLDELEIKDLNVEDLDLDVAPISYDNLKNSIEPKLRNRIKQKKEKKLDVFNYLCWILAIITSIFLGLESFNLITITHERMIIYGVIFFLIILPFYGEFKFGDLALKRESKHESKG